jgi:hypothetical protein
VQSVIVPMVATIERTSRLTAPALNDRIRFGTETRLAYYAEHPEEIGRRLRELDEEWDTGVRAPEHPIPSPG